MEIISSNQLEKYENIFEEINREFAKSEQLKKEIEDENNKIIALKLGESSCKQKLSHVNVKIFNSIAEIFTLYDDQVKHCDFHKLCKYENCKFYLIEVFLTKCLLQKLMSLQCKIQISVYFDTFNTSKVLYLPNKMPITEIIPVNSEILECKVETNLFLFAESLLTIIQLNSVDVDISYHFATVKEKNKLKTLPENLLNVVKLHSNFSNYVQELKYLQTEIKCHFNKNDFIASIVKNSYHKVDLELFSEFVNENKHVVKLQLTVADKKLVISYNKNLNILKLQCHPNEMLVVKKYFMKYMECDRQQFMQKFKNIVRKKISLNHMDLDELFLLYKEMRKLWM